MSNIVDWATGQPLAANSLDSTRKTSAINARLARKIQEATPVRLLGYLASVLPVQDPDFQVRFVLEREKWNASVLRSYWLALRAISRLSSPLRRPSSVAPLPTALPVPACSAALPLAAPAAAVVPLEAVPAR